MCENQLEECQFGFEMSIRQLLRKKRDKEELTKKEIEYFISCLVEGNITDCQIGAMLMAMYIQGIGEMESVHLTQAMILSGEQLQWPVEWEDLLVDKHSTGGVGDKISLVLAPVLAACGLKVPMLSGRSLEHTGGTLDKLESIPGFTVDLDQEKRKRCLENAGCFVASTSNRLCPADKILYSIRDITSTVDCIHLIVSSIISKKIASGSKCLVIDVKVGKAAFCKNTDTARDLAKQLMRVSGKLGMRTRVVLTRMDEPLGYAAGNALEVAEVVQCLSGNMPASIDRLISVIGSNLLEMTHYKGNAEQLIREVIDNGSAMDRFKRMLLGQGVNEETVLQLIRGEPVLPTAKYTTQLVTHESGWVLEVDALKVGQVCLQLGASRHLGTDVIDPAVGVVVHKSVGEAVSQGEVWATIHHSTTVLPQATVEYLQRAITIVTTQVEQTDLIIEIIR